jgi:hypothetical protein
MRFIVDIINEIEIMKVQSSKCRGWHKLHHLVGACFGLFTVRLPKAGRPAFGKGRTAVIAGTRGLYFVRF